MNGVDIEQGMDYAYRPQCPYRDTCPARTRCPYCPHQLEGMAGMNPGDYSKGNMQMEYYVRDNANPVPYPYESIAPEELGYENLYPVTNNMNTGMGNYGNQPVSPQYNPYGYINPDENIYSPWANNAMYGGFANPLPMKNCPFQ